LSILKFSWRNNITFVFHCLSSQFLDACINYI
jgi:hypothetical protein